MLLWGRELFPLPWGKATPAPIDLLRFEPLLQVVQIQVDRSSQRLSQLPGVA